MVHVTPFAISDKAFVYGLPKHVLFTITYQLATALSKIVRKSFVKDHD